VTDELQRAEARYAEALDDLRRFELRMALIFSIGLWMFFFGIVGLVILKVIQ
jgi:hypothetical protein